MNLPTTPAHTFRDWFVVHHAMVFARNREAALRCLKDAKKDIERGDRRLASMSLRMARSFGHDARLAHDSLMQAIAETRALPRKPLRLAPLTQAAA